MHPMRMLAALFLIGLGGCNHDGLPVNGGVDLAPHTVSPLPDLGPSPDLAPQPCNTLELVRSVRLAGVVSDYNVVVNATTALAVWKDESGCVRLKTFAMDGSPITNNSAECFRDSAYLNISAYGDNRFVVSDNTGIMMLDNSGNVVPGTEKPTPLGKFFNGGRSAIAIGPNQYGFTLYDVDSMANVTMAAQYSATENAAFVYDVQPVGASWVVATSRHNYDLNRYELNLFDLPMGGKQARLAMQVPPYDTCHSMVMCIPYQNFRLFPAANHTIMGWYVFGYNRPTIHSRLFAFDIPNPQGAEYELPGMIESMTRSATGWLGVENRLYDQSGPPSVSVLSFGEHGEPPDQCGTLVLEPNNRAATHMLVESPSLRHFVVAYYVGSVPALRLAFVQQH